MNYFLALLLLFLPFHCKASDCYNDTVVIMGDVGQYLIPAVGFAMTVKLKDWEGTRQMVKGGVAAQLTSLTLKYTIDCERPNKHDCCSFPSGHTTMAFYGAGFIKWRYGWKYAVPAFIGAGFVGYSRIQTKKHWVSDVVAGAAIGLFYNWLFTTPYQCKLKVYPAIAKGSYAICCDYEL